MVHGILRGPEAKTDNANRGVSVAELASSEPNRSLAMPTDRAFRYGVRIVGRILLTVLALGVTSFIVLVLIGLQASWKTPGVISYTNTRALRFEPLASASDLQHGLKLVGMS